MKKIKKNKKTLPEFRQHYTKENLAETSLLFPQVTEQPNCSGLILPPRGDLGNCDLPYTRPLPLRDIMRLKNSPFSFSLFRTQFILLQAHHFPCLYTFLFGSFKFFFKLEFSRKFHAFLFFPFF